MLKGFLFFIKQGWKYDKCYVIWNVLYQLVNAPQPVLAALLPKLLIDELMGAGNVGRLWEWILLLTGCMFVSSVLSVYFRMDGFSRRCRVAAEFDAALHAHLCRCDYENFEDPQFYDRKEKASRFLNCNQHGFGYLLDCAMNLCGHMLTLSGIAAIIVRLDIRLLLLFAVLSVLGAAAEGAVRKKVKAMDDAVIADQRGWMYYAGLFEGREYAKEIRVFGIGDWLLSRERAFFERTNANLKRQNDAFIRCGILTACFTFLQQCAAYGVLIGEVLSEHISVGDFTMYISAVTVFASTFRQMMSAFVEIRAYDMYYEHLDQYLSRPMTLRRGTRPIPVGQRNMPHEISFRNVSFRYPGSDCFALQSVNLTLSPGQSLMLVGENGAGKTTFIKLLLRLYAPTEGEILFDGINIADYDYDSYLSLFSAVFQDYRLYAFSLADNVAMEEDSDTEKTESLLRAAGFGDKLDALPGGVDTVIGKQFSECGFEPSGGEGQKIALARALYRDAPIIVLDEPTAALDPRAEAELYEQFHKMIRGRGAVCVSHRMYSARFCDAVAVFSHGRLIEYGSHEELMQRGGTYAGMYRMQAEQYL